jgi:TP901 family phage tail tape measure protein
VADKVATVGARLVLLGQKEYIAKIKDAQKAQQDLGATTKTTGSTMAAAAKEADKLAAANQRVATATKAATESQAGLDEALAASVAASDAAATSDDAQVVSLKAVADANVATATAARDAAAVEAEAAAAAATAQEDASAKAIAANDRTAASSEKAASVSKGAMLGIVGATVLVGYEAIKGATNYETQMTRLTTAAGMPKATVDASSQSILNLATATGFAGDKIAEALYHPVSAGLDMATSLAVVTNSAKEAQISGANLDDTTYSLSSVMKAFNKPAEDATNTMALLNAVVGDGDMHFQDFNTSVKSWTPVAATFGVDIQSAGAALAYMTDRGAPAAVAGTQLGMAMTLLGAPSKQASKMLTAVGLSSDQALSSSQAMTEILKKAGLTTLKLADDMRGPDGIHTALVDLKTHMDNAGLSADAQSALIARAFGGGKSGKAIMSLMTNLDGLQQKFDQIGSDSSATKFEESWKQTTDTTRFKLAEIRASIDNFLVKIGAVLLPYFNKALDLFKTVFDYLASHETVLKTLAGILVGVLGFALLATIDWLFGVAAAVVAATWEFALIVVAIAGLVAGFVYLYTHFQGFHDFVNMAANNIKTWILSAWAAIKAKSIELWPTIKQHAIDTFAAIVRAVTTVVNWIRDHWSEIKSITKTIWDFVSTIVVTTVKVIFNVIATVVTWFRDHWSQIVSIAKTTWNVIVTVIKVAVAVVVAIFKAIVAAAIWVWDEVLKPVGRIVMAIIGGFAPVITFFKEHWGEISSVVKAEAHVAWAIIQVMWGIIKGIFDVAIPVVVGIFRLFWNVLVTVLKVAWDIIKAIISVAWEIIVAAFKVARDVILGVFSVFLDLLTGHWSQAWDDIKHYLGAIWDDIFTGTKAILSDFFNMVTGVWNDLWGGIKSIASGIWTDVKNIFVGGINGVIAVVNGFLSAINTIAGAVGLNLNLHVDDLGGSAGGGGSQTFSSPAASASSASRANAMPNSAVKSASRGSVPQFAQGGQIGGGFVTSGPQVLVGEGNSAYPEYVIPTDPSYRARALALFSGLGGDLGTMPKFADGGVIGAITGGISSAAGSVWNGAKDVASAASSVAKMGLSAAMSAAWPKLDTGSGMMGLLPGGINFIRDKVLAFVQGKNDAAQAASGANVGGGSGAVPTGEHLALIDAALTANGVSKDSWALWEAGMSTLIGRESGWNSGIVNNWDSNAAAGTPSGGLTQTILPTFNAYRNPALSSNMFDPVANIAASINYIMKRYGGIEGVQQANPNLPAKGYAQGAKLVRHMEARAFGGGVNAGQPYRVGELGPEVFVPGTSGTMIPNSRPGSPSSGSNGGFGNTYVTVAEGAITVVESRDPRKTYELVKQGIADAVARQ